MQCIGFHVMDMDLGLLVKTEGPGTNVLGLWQSNIAMENG